MDKVYIVMGGCAVDAYVIAVYEGTPNGKALAYKRAKEENRQCRGLEAYVEERIIER